MICNRLIQQKHRRSPEFAGVLWLKANPRRPRRRRMHKLLAETRRELNIGILENANANLNSVIAVSYL